MSRKSIHIPKELLEELASKYKLYQISKITNHCHATIRKLLIQYNIKIKSQKKEKYQTSILLRKKTSFLRNKTVKSKHINKTKNINQVLKNKLIKFFVNEKTKEYNSMFSIKDLREKIGDNPVCYLTGDSIDLSDGKTYQLDHIIPRSRGGDNSLDNCGLTSSLANKSKSDMTIEEYIELCRKVIIWADKKQS